MPNRKPDDADLSGIKKEGQGQSANIGRGADLYSQHSNAARAHKGESAEKVLQQESGKKEGKEESFREEGSKSGKSSKEQSKKSEKKKSEKGKSGKSESGHKQSPMVEDEESLASKMEEFDFELLEEFEKEIEEDKELQEEFKKDPEKVARDEGIELPEGFKISFNEQYAKDKSSVPFTHMIGETNPCKIELRFGHLIIKE